VKPGSAPIDAERWLKRAFDWLETRTGWVRRQTWIAVSAAAMIGLICCVSGTLVFLPASNDPPTATFAPLPPVSVADALDALPRAGILPTARTVINIADTRWPPYQAIRFAITRGDERGTFLLIGFATAAEVGPSVLTLPEKSAYRTWEARQFSNLLLLTRPDASAALADRLGQALTAYAVAPYRPFLQTPAP
jgi:hypothetical protein